MAITIEEILNRLNTLAHDLMIKSLNSTDNRSQDAYEHASGMVDEVIEVIKSKRKYNQR